MAGQYGPGQTGAVQELEFYAAAGTLTLPLHRGGSATQRQRDIAVRGEYVSGEARPTNDVVRRFHSFSMGAGWSRRPSGMDGEADWAGVADGENVCYRFGYICPGGEQTELAVDASWGPVKKIVPFNGDLVFVFLNRIAYMAGGTGALTSLYSLSGDQFTDAEYWQGSLRIANLCTHTGVGVGQKHSFVTMTPAAPYTFVHPDMTISTPRPPQFRLFVTVFWEYQGVGNTRLWGQTSDTTYRYMITPSGDPYVDANWSAEIQVGESTFEIRQLAASHDTAWPLKQDGVYSITDKNGAAGGENMTPYWKSEIDAGAASAVAYYWQSQLVVGRNTTVEAIDVNSQTVLDAPRPIHVSHGRPNDGRINGRYTAFCSNDGWLVAALSTTAGAQVMYGTPRRRESPIAGVTEFDWFGPEVGPIPGVEITAMTVHTPESTLRPYLWLGGFGPSGVPILIKVDLFKGSSPLADTAHRYSTTASVTLTDEHWGARSATKGALRGSLTVRHCGSGRRVDLYAVAGANSSFPVAPNVQVSTNVETHPFDLTAIRGAVIKTRLNLISGATIPVVVDELEYKANLGFPLRSRGSWLVELSDLSAHSDLPNNDDTEATEAALVRLCETVEAFDALCDDGETRTIVLDNVLPWQAVESSQSERKIRVLEIKYQIVSGP